MRLTSFLVFFLLAVGLAATEFLLGTYSLTSSSLPFTNLLYEKMQEAQFNTAFVTAGSDSTCQRSWNIMTQRNLKSVLLDDTWDWTAHPVQVSLPMLTMSNYLRFEAEYAYQNTILNDNDATDDRFFYRFTRDVGKAVPQANASNQWVWQATQQPKDPTPTLLMNQLTWRQQDPNNWHITNLCKFPNHGDAFDQQGNLNTNSKDYRFLQDNSLYITFSLHWEEDTQDTDTLLGIEFMGYNQQFSATDFIVHNFSPLSSNYSQNLRVCDFHEGQPTEDPSFRTFTYRISLWELYQQHVLVNPNQQCWSLIYFAPRIIWKKNHTVSIDYIELEDELHRRLAQNDPELQTALKTRLTQIVAPNTTAYYGSDEPYPGNYDSFRLLKDWLNTPEFVSVRRPLVTATNYWAPTTIRKPDGTGFDNQALFLKIAEPNTLMPDHYPITIGNKWNTDGSGSVQQQLTDLASRYEVERNLTFQSDTRFMPITQSFGEGVSSSSGFQWIWRLLPPFEMQKCLQYLPLCFGANGLSSFCLRTVYSKKCRIYGLLSSDGNLPPTEWYSAIQTANAKIAVYGSQLADAVWIGTHCLMETPAKPYHDKINGVHYSDLAISPSPNSARSDYYSGYIQIGFYRQNDDISYLMVNRRANFTTPDADVTHASPNQYPQIFTPAPPQTVCFLPSAAVHERFGAQLGLYDPYLNEVAVPEQNNSYPEQDTITITIPPGEATLRTYVPVLTGTVGYGRMLYLNTYVVKGMEIPDQVLLTIPKDITLHLTKNSTLTIHKGGTLRVYGKLLKDDTARIIVEEGGKLEP